VDSTTIIIIGIVVILIAIYLFRRSRPAPRGTYDDESVRSSGSIGGGTRAYDDPNHRSSGSIGGKERGYNSPEHKSSGSIGVASTDRKRERDDLDNEPLDRTDRPDRVQERKERRHDDDQFKSGGSFGR
jgi:hypothetical protein